MLRKKHGFSSWWGLNNCNENGALKTTLTFTTGDRVDKEIPFSSHSTEGITRTMFPSTNGMPKILPRMGAKDCSPELSPQLIPTSEKNCLAHESFFTRLKQCLSKTRQHLGYGCIGLFRSKKIDDSLFETLEERLLIADVGVETTKKIINKLINYANCCRLKEANTLYNKLREEMGSILLAVEQPLVLQGQSTFVILMVGVNGVGKTTSIGKLAHRYRIAGKSVMLAAGDTFRASAIEQLQIWGERNHIPVLARHIGADSASVIFDAIRLAKTRGIDVLIADTAGRLQNKVHLMEELKKIVGVVKKLDAKAPHEVMLILDATTGQNIINQTSVFDKAVGLTGISMTKLDGTAKGGGVFAIADRFGIPIRYIGVGEGIEDLRPFKAADFIEALFLESIKG